MTKVEQKVIDAARAMLNKLMLSSRPYFTQEELSEVRKNLSDALIAFDKEPKFCVLCGEREPCECDVVPTSES